MSDDEAKKPDPSEAAASDSEDDGGEAAALPARTKKASAAGGSSSEAEAGAEGSAGADTGDAAAPRRDLPKWNRARVKRKAPAGEEQDAFQASVRKAGRGILQRPWAVIGLIVAAAGLGAGIYAWVQSGESDRAEATAVLATAVAFEARGQVYEDYDELVAERVRPLAAPVVKDQEQLRQSVDDALSNLEERNADAPANLVADLVRAARLARASDFPGAEKAYRGFLEQQPGHALVFMARDGLIISLEAQGRWDDALAEVEPMLGAEGDFFRDQALWHKGRLLEGAERTEDAVETYKQYIAEYPLDKESQARDQVRARLEALAPDALPPLPETPIPGGLGGFGP